MTGVEYEHDQLIVDDVVYDSVVADTDAQLPTAAFELHTPGWTWIGGESFDGA